MTETVYMKENNPFPNNTLPVLYYPEVLTELIRGSNSGQNVLNMFEENGYSNGWVNGIFSYHHFHSNTHEVLGCIAGEAQVQLGGPGAEIYTFKKGDVLLLPAGIAHKKIESTADFSIVGAYPEGLSPDKQTGSEEEYEIIQNRIKSLAVPKYDPVEGEKGAVKKYWN
ncbi:cupin domain-containing protein [Jeotgalibaca ciconiae]|uniref:Cupin type-1 domain-containing protein n=1 Tax=Jeotgalibaca ciconiae TaxID=2496265 RepID=A0A3Q9BIR3_9LACT|nr:cupin domain-containing protein [Jeotgalibaca ciconiae]AZP03301.1 hypothetical protein EJN90_00690 [Jeotgalibaca ciconiae]